MKAKLFNRALCVLLVLLLCFSVAVPAVSAATDEDLTSSVIGVGIPEIALHTSGGTSPGAEISADDVKKVFEDAALGEGDYYGIRQKAVPGSPTNLSSSSGTASVSAGEYIIYRTAVSSAGLDRTPDWEAGTSQEILIRLYYTAEFSVSGCDDGKVYLNGEAVSGSVELFIDTQYTVTAKQVEHYQSSISGAPDVEAFTPTSDMTISAVYVPEAHAAVTINMNGEGSVKLLSGGEELTTFIPIGASFEVEAQPNADRGYLPGTVVVTKNGVVQEGDTFGPAEDGDSFAVNVNFVFAPEEVNYEVNAASPKLKSSDFNTMFGESGNHSYGYASVNAPDNIKAVNLSSGTNFSAGEYYIYSAPYNKNNPDWSVAKVRKMNLRTYYIGSFTVTGNENGKVYLNNTALDGNTAKLYTDTQYTVTAEKLDEYFYILSGVEEGAAFTPSSEINVKVTYYKTAHAVFTLSVNGSGSASVKSDGETTAEIINEGSTFTVETSPNTSRGYRLDNIVVTKDGVEVESADGAYGPVNDGETYAITVNFKFEPNEVNYDLHADSKLTSTIINGLFGDSALNLFNKSYGYANVETPDQINKVNTSGVKVGAGEYYIYRADGTSKPDWSTARVLKLNLRTYYNGNFTVNGHTDGAIYLNGNAVSGKTKLYTGTEYTVTVKEIEGYDNSIDGVTAGETFTPSKDINVTLIYSKPAFATFTLNAGNGGTATVRSGEFTVTDQINAGSTFAVEPHPNTDRGYKLDKIVVTKDGEEVSAVDGEYGPVADGESYVINVSFKFEPKEVKYDLHANSKLTSTILYGLFGDSVLNLFNKSYGFASVEAPDQITKASTDGNTVEPGEYYIYRADGTSNPNWSTAKVLKLNLKTYYNGTFAATGHDEGEIRLNGDAVNGSVKLYTNQEYTVTVKPIEGYICTLFGAEDGVTFTPSTDIDATAAYVKDSYAAVTVSSNAGGTVKLMSGGNELFDKIPEGSRFTVEADANNGSGYYVENITVTRDGEEIEAVDGEYGPVSENESYEVNVTFAKAVLTLQNGEVGLSDIFYKNYEAVKQSILKNAVLVPGEFADKAQIEVEYVAYTLLGYAVYEPLDYQNDTGHLFGTSERGGTLKGGNTEKVRVTVTLPSYGIELRATAVMTVNEDRVETKINSSSDSFTITYGDDLKAEVFDKLSVKRAEDGAPVEFTEDDITLTPVALNANLLSAQRAQEVTVRYNGSDIYAISETTVNVYVRRAQSSLEGVNESVTYGEVPEAKVVTTPESLDHLKVIAGIDGNAQGFVSIIVPESVKQRMQIKIAGIVVLDIYQMLTSYIGEDGASLESFKKLLGELSDTIDSNDSIRQAIESSGFNVEILERVMRFISELPNLDTNLRIRLEQTPKNAGTYMMFAVSTDSNYTTSEDIAYIIIRPKTSTDEEPVELSFREEMQSRSLSYEEAQNFKFGGDLYVNGELTEVDNLQTLYVGTTLGGDIISQSEPVKEPGVYTESVFMIGGNYLVTPIVREFTINRNDTKLLMDDLTVTYDGAQHSVEVTHEDGEAISGNISVLYSGTGYLSSRAPVNAGEYTVLATYAGDDLHKPATASAKLTIEKREAVIKVSCKESLNYGEINDNNLSNAKLNYTVSGTVNNDRIGIITPVLNTGDNFPNAGEYTATARVIQTNSNYSVTIEEATLTILPKHVIVTIDPAEKLEGDKDPEFTYKLTDMLGRRLGVKLDVKLAREEGEKAGTYRIYVDTLNDTNYTLDEASVDGVLTIKTKPYMIGDANSDGVVDVLDAAVIQKYSVGKANLTADQLYVADVNNDNNVGVLDAAQIQKYSVGKITEFNKKS